MDWNEDGKKDLLVGDSYGYINLFTNNGTNSNPSLSAGVRLKVGGADLNVGNRAIPCVNDWNQDGKKDLLCGQEDGRVALFINVGTNSNPQFNSTQYIKTGGVDLDVGTTTYDRSSPRVVDLDKDGLKDLVIGNKDGIVLFYANSGSNANPIFTTSQKLNSAGSDLDVGAYARIDMYDWDGDGDMDLLSGDGDGYVTLFKNEAPAGQQYAVDLEPETQTKYVSAGGSATHTISVKNSGNNQDTITLTRITPPSGWTATLSHTAVTLQAGASTNITFTVTAPSSASVGATATLDVTGTCGDGTTKDQVQTITIVQQQNLADLLVERAYLVKPDNDNNISNDIEITTPALGEQVRLICKVTNLGTVAANNWKIQGFMDGTKLAEGTFSLGAGMTTYIWRTSSWTATGGSHILEWKVDTDNIITELNENNNKASYNFTVPGQGIADLCMERAYLVLPDNDYDASNDVEITQPIVGQDIRLICKVSNLGTADANTWQIQGHMDGTKLAEDDFSLPAGFYTIIWRTQPWTATDGTHILEWHADTRNDIPESNEGNNNKSYTFNVSGGTIPDISSNPTSWDYGSVAMGNYSDKTFVIKNDGTANLNVTATTLTGTNASEFSIQSGGGSFTLAPSATRNIVVRFSPTSAGSKSASLSISSNDPDKNPFDVELRGGTPTGEPEWKIPITISGGGNILTRNFGGDADASSGLDAFDVAAAPPGMTYYAYFEISVFPNYLDTDIRGWVSPYKTDIDWTFKIVNTRGVTSTLSWNPANIPTGSGIGTFTLVGPGLNVNMRSQGSVQVNGDATLIIQYRSGITVTYNFPKQGWYLISLPLTPPNNSLSVLFPTAMAAFAYDPSGGSYIPVTSLEPKKGYWLLIPSATSSTITGVPLMTYTEHYNIGWHLIGTVASTTNFTDPNDNPNGSVIATYGWNPATSQYYPVYPPGTGVLNEKEGYWLAVAKSCDLIIGSSALSKDAVASEVDMKAFYQRFGAQPPVPPFLADPGLAQSLPPENVSSRIYPNPFNLETVIEYWLPQAGFTRVYIYNSMGQRIRTLVESQQSQGIHHMVWDGRNDNGEIVTNGIYFYRIITPEFVETQKIILLK